MEKIKLKVSKRQDKKNNQLRREGIIPANMYQAGKESVSLELNGIDFIKLIRNLNENAIVHLQVNDDKKESPVLIDEIQYDSFGKNILHVVFRKISLSEKIKADISIELVGEFEVDDGVLVLAKDSVEVEALPTDLPEKFEVDQSLLKEIGDRVVLSDLQFDKDKIELILGEEENPEETVIVLVQEKAEEIEEEPGEELVEPELAGEKQENAGEVEKSTEKSSESSDSDEKKEE